MRRVATAVAALGASLAAGTLSPAQAGAIDFCGPSERACSRLVVPLDRTGKVPGRVGLQVELSRAKAPARPPLFLIAGGPGQSATRAFDSDSISAILGAERRARHVVVIDQRGTGDSDVLRCPSLERANLLSARDAAAACAAALGSRRAFYTTRDSVEDIETVRRELGAPKIALLGVSYGTKVALGYALAHPDRVERIVLDSVVEAGGPSALGLETLAGAPGVVRSRCRPGCRRFTGDPVRDVRRLAARIAKRPLRGRVIDRRGRARRAALTSFDLVLLLVAGDLDTDLRREVPAAVRSALRGDSAPILRLAREAEVNEGELSEPREISAAVFTATVCEELALPWARTAPVADRRRQARALVAGLPASAFGPFGRDAALDGDVVSLCERWPAAASAPSLDPGPLPDVPVLALAGDADARTPVESARRAVAAFPRGRLLVAPGSGHDALGQDVTGCITRATRRFLAGVAPPRRCPRAGERPLPRPQPFTIRDVRRKRGVPGRAARTLTVVDLTLDFAAKETVFLFVRQLEDALSGKLPDVMSVSVGGLRGGTASIGGSGALILRRVAVVRGVRVSGRLRKPFERGMRGSLRITGRAAARGRLTVRGRRVTGRLGGRAVSARLRVPNVGRLVEELLSAASSARRDRPLIRGVS